MNKGSEMRAETQRAGACSSEELTVAHRRLTAVVQSREVKEAWGQSVWLVVTYKSRMQCQKKVGRLWGKCKQRTDCERELLCPQAISAAPRAFQNLVGGEAERAKLKIFALAGSNS